MEKDPAKEIVGHHRAEARAALKQVPVPLEVAAQWAWRLIVIGVVAYALMTAVATLGALAVPLAIALLIAAPLERTVGALSKRGIKRTWGALMILLSLVVTVLGLLAAAGKEFVSSFDELRAQASDGLDTVITWLSTSPLHVDPVAAHDYLDHLGSTITEHKSSIVSGALSVTGTVGALLAGTLIGLVCLFFFLRDGRKLWIPIVRLFPKRARDDIDRAGTAAWATLAAYTKTSVFVALVQAIGTAIAVWLLGIPLVIPIAILVFLGSFIPMIGTLITGAVVILVALVDGGWATALIMTIAIVVIEEVKSILYPWIFGKATSMHPLAILISLSIGTILAGGIGALLSVPVFAVARVFINEWRDEDEDDDDDGLEVTRPIRIRRWSDRRR